jgi:SAM-dependent methyltransferase
MISLPRRQLLTRLGAAGAGLLLPAPGLLAQDSAAAPALDVPFVPTPQEVVERMLQMAKVGKDDVLYDLGCGDGRIVVTAAKAHGARGTGIDIDPERIGEARKNAEQAGVAGQVSFKVADLFETDISPASVVTLYLLPNINTRLRPRLWKQLKVGARVVSHAFDMGPEWPPDKTDSVDGRSIYYWTIKPAHKRAVKA